MAAAPPVTVFVDLDDTLFQTRRKCPSGQELEAAAFARDGSALSFTTPMQRLLLDWLSRDAVLIPVTGRNSAALERVCLPFTSYAITSFGGVILKPDRTPESAWCERMQCERAGYADAMDRLHSDLSSTARDACANVRVTVVTDHDLPLYLSVKHNETDVAALAAFAVHVHGAVPADWTTHLNGNNLAFLPAAVDKAHAVRYVLEHLIASPGLTVGAGDSLSDARFMMLCDVALTPTRTQLGRHLEAAHD